MILLLRRVKYERWYQALESGTQPLPADPLADLNTEGNELSVWAVEEDRSNLNQVVTAMAAQAGTVKNIDVVLIQDGEIDSVWEVDEAEGRTPLANAKGHHRNVVGLAAVDLPRIAELIRQHGNFQEFSDKDVRNLLIACIDDGSLRATDLQPAVREHLRKRNLIP